MHAVSRLLEIIDTTNKKAREVDSRVSDGYNLNACQLALEMLQIIVFQLSFGIWLLAGLNEKESVKSIGLWASLAFAMWGIVQGLSISS